MISRLYDANTNEDLGEASEAQALASQWSWPDGIIFVDVETGVIGGSLVGQPNMRAVYVESVPDSVEPVPGSGGEEVKSAIPKV